MVNEIPERPDDNPLYLLATLYGQPSNPDDDLAAQNRVAWNRYMAAEIGDELRSNLTKTGQYSAEELTPFSPQELQTFQSAFADRSGTSTKVPEIPETIGFSNVQFDKPFFAKGFIFFNGARFEGATFSGPAYFSNATFSGDAFFGNATFSRSTDFGSAIFSGPARFGSATFTHSVNFGSATFSSDARFGSAIFSGPARFGSATFSSDADFRSATFSYVSRRPGSRYATIDRRYGMTESANFGSATFSGPADFSNATFFSDADFHSATFSAIHTLRIYRVADFGSATFSGLAYFGSATFSDLAGFGDATFSGPADFNSATFSDRADFSRATFSGLANFQRATFGQETLFVDAKMESQTSFAEVKFSQPPQFFNAKLHEGTRWPDRGWPKPKDDATARDYLAAYERLKLEMDRMKKHGDELDFFVLELQCRRVILGFWRGIPIAAYGFLCDYGRSFMRPLGFLVIIGISGAVLIRVHFGGGWAPATFTDHGFGGGAVGLSFANTFGILGISRDLIGPSVVQKLPGWLKVVLAFQTVFGIGLLFLFGLAIRNRFRMR